MVKIKANIDGEKLRRILNKRRTLIKDNITAVIKQEAIPVLIDEIMRGYYSLSDRANSLPEDPTNPSQWRQVFLNKLESDLERNLIITQKGLIVRLGDREFLGYDQGGSTNSDDDTPLVWLVYYIEGLAGDWAFITPEIYERFRGTGTFQRDWGRFGAGFMMSREQYEEEGWTEVASFESVKHPFSGFSPVDIFTEALREFRLRPFIDKAIRLAAQGRKI